MFRLTLAAALALCACVSGASPFLVSQPYATLDSGTMKVNGGAPIACSLEQVTGGVRNRCDLGALTTPGTTYTIVQTVCVASSLVNGTNTATFAPGGCADGAPFAFKFNGGSVTPPAGQTVP